jgi:large subunit ribosomal protein L3
VKALLAKKIGMTQIFDESGVMTPVTVLEAGPCVITQLKSEERDGYSAVQIGFGEAKHQAKPQAGHLKPAKANSRFLTEYRVDGDQPEMTIGDELKADVFAVGDSITVSAVSKGKGFAGTIKRHNFARGPMSHGSHNHRAPGSIGAGYPQHVFKGQKMAGQMGNKAVTVKNLKVMEVDVENNLLVVRGAVPGPKKSLVMVRG